MANIAEQLDAGAAKLGDVVKNNAVKLNNDDDDDNDAQNNITMTPSSDTDFGDDEENGWGGSDGDDLDFEDDEEDDMGSSGVDVSYDDVPDEEEEEEDTALDNIHPEASSTSVAAATVADTTTTTPQPTAQQPQSPPHTFPEIVSVSAPGKALVAGGYLVLESPNPGVVLAADGCRFHTTITFRQPCITTSTGGGVIGNSIDATWESVPLDVYSPQFDKIFCYYLSYSLNQEDVEQDDDGKDVLRLQPRTASHEPNKFVERTLLLVFGYLRQSLGKELFHSRFRQHGLNSNERVALAIKLRADNDFYSQINHLKQRGLDLTPQDVESLEPFLPCPKDSGGKVIVNKTGMGSSAALVTSIVGALLQFFGASSLPMIDQQVTVGQENHHGEGLRIAHNLAQICHCYAQGKVGSGFDVSSAVFGSHVYTRFSKNVINNFIEDVEARNETVKDGLSLAETDSFQLVELVTDADQKWDCSVQPINLPEGLELLMADVCGGSESPSMARKILEWKKKNRETGFLSGYYWRDLKRCNKKIASLLSDQYTKKPFCDGLVRDGQMIIASRTAEQWKKPMPSTWHEFDGSSWDVAMQLLDLRMAFLESRQNLKGMGAAAGVPVEPDSQTALADATMKLPGVVAAGVPGAGGYDALFVIYVKGPPTNGGKSDQVRDEIGNLWRDLSNQDNNTVVCPLSVRAAGSGGLCASSLQW